MLKSISLENYKCFKEKTDIEIAPLTVLCGVNSSGKSSILKSLLMLKQSYENESSSHSFLLSGEYVDNGSFDDVIYHVNRKDIKDNDIFKISSSYLIRDTSDAQGKNLVKRQDIVSFKELKRVFYQSKNIKYVKYFNFCVEIISQRPNKSDSPFEFYIESNVIKDYNITIELLDSNLNKIDTLERYIYVKKNPISSNDGYENDGWLLSWKGIPSTRNNNPIDKIDYPCTCYFSGLQIKNIYADNMTKDVIGMLPNLLAIFKIAAFQSDGFSFIAPLREQPIRRYNINGDVNSVGISGEKTPILLAKEAKNKKTDCIPPYNIKKDEKEITIWKTKKDSFYNLVSKWMEYFDLGKVSLGGSNGLIEVNINEHNLADVGFGVSQALPIIVQGLYMDKDQSLLLEQPEIHLHPEMQLQMADFLIALAKNEKNIIVETHSDHIINRLVHRIIDDDTGSLQNIIKILFIDKDSKEVKDIITPIIISPTKGVIDAPYKFFSQFSSETQKIIFSTVKNRTI